MPLTSLFQADRRFPLATQGVPHGYPIINVVQDFGADPTGTRDSTREFEEAYDAAQGMEGRVEISMPGIFLLSKFPTITKHGLIIRGTGARHQGTHPSKLRYTGDTETEFINLLGVQGVQLIDFSIENIGGNAATIGVAQRGAQRCILDNFHALPETSQWGTGLLQDTTATASCIYNTARSCTFGGVFGAPLGVGVKQSETHQASDGKVTNNNSFYDVTIGNRVIGNEQTENPSESVWYNVEARGCTRGYIARGRGLTIVGGNIETCTVGGIEIPAGATSAELFLFGPHFDANPTNADIINTAKRPIHGSKEAKDIGSVSGVLTAFDASRVSKIRMTLSGNITIPNPVNEYDGAILIISMQQDGTGTRTVTWDTQFKVAGWIPDTAAFKINTMVVVHNTTSSQWVRIGGDVGL